MQLTMDYENRYKAAFEMKAKGLTLKYIAEHFGVCRGTAMKYIKKAKSLDYSGSTIAEREAKMLLESLGYKITK